MEERDTIGKAFRLVGGIWNRDEAVARFTLARRFARIAADLMGVDAIRLYHDVAITKEPGGGYTPWHQDSYYWPMDTRHTVTMWMALVDISYEMGSLNFASGSYLCGDLGDEAISDRSHAYFEHVIRERGLPVVNHVAHGVMAAGDATFHAGWTLHSAPGNATDRTREAITVVYYADGTLTFPDMGNPHREWDFHTYMPGVRPGGAAASPLNPLLYRRSDDGNG
jgi:ectoine hydroxylase-related dioxygenase (phytanoyl-CoA dioxygenase family)